MKNVLKLFWLHQTGGVAVAWTPGLGSHDSNSTRSPTHRASKMAFLIVAQLTHVGPKPI
jgi:hypothetical protein